jgi:pilus assembly protein CpaB
VTGGAVTGGAGRVRAGWRGPRRGPARRLTQRHRRIAAAVLVGVAAAVCVEQLAPPPPGVPVTVARHDLAVGRVLGAADLEVVHLPPSAVPAGVLDAEALLGTRLASAVRAREPVTDVRVSGAGVASAVGAGQVAVAVRLAGEVGPWLTVGQRLRLHAAPVAGAAVGEVGGAAGRGVEVTVLDLAPAPGAGAGVLAPLPADDAPVGALVQVRADDAARLVGLSGEPLAAVLVAG